MTNQEQLAQILKKKGIGPESSKSLKEEDIQSLRTLMKATDVSLTTKATLLTAILTLTPTALEKQLIEDLYSRPQELLPEELLPFINGEASPFQTTINTIIRHKNLTHTEAEEAVKHLFDDTPAFLKGAFLEAERLKRETYDENSAFFKVMKSHVPSRKANVPVLIDLGDSYDGCTRTPSLNLFLAAILAASGYPTIVHSVDAVAPKKGVTHHQILKSANKKALCTVEDAISNLENPDIGWAYLDQQVYHPKLYALKQVREEMVKRPFLATFEKMLQPVLGQKNYIVSQYTHKHYKLEVAKLIQDFCSFEKAIHVKGIEGTCMVNPKIPAECVLIRDKKMEELSIYGEEQGYGNSLQRHEDITPEYCLSIGLDILRNKDIPEKNFLVFQGALLIHHFFDVAFETAKKQVETAISTFSALNHWEGIK